MKCAIYCRVSTDEQKEGRTIESQVQELRDFAQANNHNIMNIYLDDGWSGSLLNRPGLDLLRDDAGKGLFEAVLVNDVDRLSRELVYLGIIKRDLEKKNVKLVFKKLPSNDDPLSNFMINILGSFAEFERELITDRTRRGRRYKVEIRKLILGNIPPYGYDYVKKDKESGIEGHYVINQKEAQVVQMMFDWVVKERISQREVVRRLTELKIPPKKGNKWGRSSVHRILTNETYIGTTYYNKNKAIETDNHGIAVKYRKRKTGSRLRPRDEWIAIRLPHHLKIIDEEIFWAGQAQFNKNKVYASRNSKYFYLLRGLVKCGECNSPYFGTPCHGKLFYRCGNRHKTFPAPKKCKRGMIRANMLETLVWNSLSKAIQNPSIIIEQVNILKEKARQKPLQSEQKMEEIKKQTSNLKVEEERIFEAYRKGVIELNQFQREVDKLSNERTNLKKELNELENNKFFNSYKKIIIKSVEEYCQIIRNKIKKFTSIEKQTLLRLLIEKIIIEDGRVRILGLLPVRLETQEKPSYEPNKELVANIVLPEIYHCGHNTTYRFELEVELPGSERMREAA